MEAEGDPRHRVVGGKREDPADAVEIVDLLLGAAAAGGRKGADLVAELAQPAPQVPYMLGHASRVAVVVGRDQSDLHEVTFAVASAG